MKVLATFMSKYASDDIATTVRGSPIAAVMIHEWIVASTCDGRRGIHLQRTYLGNNVMVIGEVILSGISLRPHIDRSVTNPFAPAESSLMMQLCHHY